MSSITDQIKKGHSRIVRRAYIKRRNTTTGLFEDDWFEITDDVKKWGKIKSSIDAVRLNKFTLNPLILTVDNVDGRYNPEDAPSSHWYGYMSQQRTLVRVEAAFVHQSLSSDGTWANDYYGDNATWDESEWDTGAEWDGELNAFYGVVNGDIALSDQDEVTFNVSPLTQIFRDFPARKLRGLDNSITASRFMELLRDQTDGSGSLVFRPFFNNTTTNWEISTTTVNYANLNTNTADDIRDMDVWSVIEKLAEAENHVAYISNTGIFRFKSRSSNTTTAAFTFYGGAGLNNTVSPITIKQVTSFGRRISKLYTYVDVKWVDSDTTTSHAILESTLTVAGGNSSWNYGQKKLTVENFWIPTSTVANTVATTIFNDASSLKNEIEFVTSFVPHLDVLDLINVTYDSAVTVQESLWDQNDWADTSTSAVTDLIWDAESGNALVLSNEEFKLSSIEIDLDKLECKFSARES